MRRDNNVYTRRQQGYATLAMREDEKAVKLPADCPIDSVVGLILQTSYSFKPRAAGARARQHVCRGPRVSFEQGFADVERAAAAAEKAAKALAAAAKAIVRAAQEGDIGALGRNAQKLGDAAEVAAQETANARRAWPFSPEAEERFLQEGYTAELLGAADSIGLRMQQRDGLLVSYPFIIRILPAERAVRINKTRFAGLRPSRLAAKLKADQNRKSRAAVQPFLEALHNAYRLVCGKDGHGGSVPAGQDLPGLHDAAGRRLQQG